MSSTLGRIRSKVTRAKQHIVDFELGLKAFDATDPYRVSSKEDANSGKRIYYLSKADCVPDALAAIAADVIQNLRSPLDQIVYQLVIAGNNGAEPERKVYYPIRDLAAHYQSARGTIAKYVRDEVIQAIDATEPYNGGKGHALWQLNALNNPDKHQLLLGAAAFFRSFDISGVLLDSLPTNFPPNFRDMITPFYLRPADQLLGLKVGDELFSEPLNIKVQQQRRFTFDVAFNHPGVIKCEPALKTLQDFSNLVDDIVTQLGRFLP